MGAFFVLINTNLYEIVILLNISPSSHAIEHYNFYFVCNSSHHSGFVKGN